MQQPSKWTPEDKIRLLWAWINDDGFEKFEASSNKLLLRWNEFYDSNKSDIVNYFTKSIVNIPLKGGIYAYVLLKYNHFEITNAIITDVLQEIQSTNDCFKHLHVIKFLIEACIIGLWSIDFFNTFIKDITCNDKYSNLLKLVILNIVLIYDREQRPFLKEIIAACDVINSSNKFKGFQKEWELIYTYVKDETNKDNDGLYLPILRDYKNNIVTEPETTLDPFKKIWEINYNHINISSKLYWSKDTENYHTMHLKLIIIELIAAFKENYSYLQNNLFNIPLFFAIGSDANIPQKIQKLLPEVLVSLAIYTQSHISTITQYGSLSISLIKQFPEIEEDFTWYIKNLISVDKVVQEWTQNEIWNFTNFLSFYLMNIQKNKEEILGITLDTSTINNYFYINCLIDKCVNLINVDNFTKITTQYNDAFVNRIKHVPQNTESSTFGSDYNTITANIKNKVKYEDFKAEIHNIDDKNELLILFTKSLLINKSKTLSHLREIFHFYADTLLLLKEDNFLSNGNTGSSAYKYNEKDFIIWKSVFDIWGHSNFHLKFIIELLLNKFIIEHWSVIEYLFKERLNQSKENINNYIYYEIIEWCITNCIHCQSVVKKQLKKEQHNWAQCDEDARDGIIKKIEQFEGIDGRLNKENEIIVSEIFEKYWNWFDISEKWGGNELRSFIKNSLFDFVKKFSERKLISREDSEKFNDKITKLVV